MKYSHFYYIILLVLLISCKQNITQNDYPDADAVYLNMTKEYTLNDDGSMDYHYAHQLKLFSYFAFNNRYGETFIVYNPKYQALKVNKSVTVKENGENIPAPANALNEVLPQFAANAPYFNYLREMVVSHTGLDLNVTINLDYNITTKPGFLPALMSNEVLNASSPVREMNIVVRIPKSKKLNYKLLNNPIKPDSTTDNNYKIYKWKFNEVPVQTLEALQPHDNSNMMRLMFSTSDNINELLTNIVKQPAFNNVTNSDIEKGITDIMNSKKDELNKVLELQKKVVEEFNYFPIPPSYIGYDCRTAAEVWKSNGGTEIEKAVLLNTFLNKSGIKSEILAISNPYNEQRTTNNELLIMLYDNFILKIDLKNGETIYLSPIHINENNMMYDLTGMSYYSLKNNTKISFFPDKAYSNKAEVRGNFTIQNNALNGKITSVYSDKLNPYFKLKSTPESAKSLLSNSKETKITTINQNKAEIEFTFENKNAIRKEKNYVFLNIPEISNGVSSWGINSLLEKRTTNLEIPSNIDENYEYSFTLPANYKLISPVKNIVLQNKTGKLTIEIKQNGNIVNYKKTITLFSNKIDAKDYSDFKTLIDSWNNKNYKELIFKNEHS